MQQLVLGGASITGGRGSVLGTILGVFLLVIVNNSLILLGIPSYWQKVVVGLIIIISTGSTAYQHEEKRGTRIMKFRMLDVTNRDRNLLQLFVIAILVFTLMSVLNPGKFLTMRNFRSYRFQFPEYGILAIAT